MRKVPMVAGILMDLVAIAHLLRLVFHAEVTVAGSVVPMWVSVIGLIVPAAMAVLLFRDARQP